MHSGNERSTNTTENQTFPLVHLPDEILMNLFSELDLCDLAALRVNRQLNALLSDKAFWRNKFASHFPHLFHQKKSQPTTDWLLAFSEAYKSEYGELAKNKRAVKLFWLVKEDATERLLPGGDFSLTVEDLYLEAPETITELLEHGKISLVSWMRRKSNQALLNHAYELILASWPKKNKSSRLRVSHLDGAQRNILHWAVQCCQPLEEIKRLIELGADIKKLDKNNHSPLHLAAEAGNVAIVKHLIDELQQNEGEAFLSEHVLQGNYIKIYALIGPSSNKPLLLAAKEGHSQIVELLLVHGATIKDKSAYLTPLHFAAFRGDLNMVRLLLDKGANALASVGCRNPLQFAVENDHPAVVAALAQHIATNHGSLLKTEAFQSMVTAFERKDEAITKLLCNYLTEADFKNYAIGMILLYAIRANSYEIAELLFKRGVKPYEDITEMGENRYFQLIKSGNLKMIALFLRNSNLSNKEKAIMMQSAIRAGHIEVVRFLLEQDFSVAQVDFFVPPALFIAATEGQVAIAALLLQCGAKIDEIPIGEPSKGTPLCAATEKGDLSMVKLLLALGAQPNAHTKSYLNNRIPLHVAAEKGYLDIFKILLAHSADIYLTDSVGREALQLVPADKATAFGQVASKHLIDTYLAELTEKEERQSKQAPGLFASTFTFGTSVREKKDAAHALIQVLIGETDLSTLEVHQRALNQGNLGKVYKKIKEIYLSKLPSVVTHTSSFKHN